MKYKLLSILLFVLTVSAHSQITTKAETGNFLLKNVTIVSPGVTSAITDILINGNKIIQISENLNSENAKVIDCNGLYAYPGLFDSGTTMGLYEIGSMNLTKDYNDRGSLNPQLKALTAVNPHSTHIPITRVEGVTHTLVVPEGGLISGQASLITLYGNTPNQMHRSFEALVINYPSQSKISYWDRRDKSEIEKQYEEDMKTLNEMIDESILYSRIDSLNKLNNNKKYSELRLEALSDYVKNEKPVIIKADKAQSVLAALKWQEEKGLNAIISGCRDCYRIADSIAQYDVPVIVGPILSLPRRGYDKYDMPYSLPSRLHNAGVKIAILTNEKNNVRNLPYHAGFAATYGLGKELALKAVTLNPAEIFGVADKYGSIEKNKNATIVITDGDIFQPSTHVQHLFIDGAKIPLESRQTKLYNQFIERQPGVDSTYGQ